MFCAIGQLQDYYENQVFDCDVPVDYNQLKEDNMLKRLYEYAVRINR